MSTLNLTPTAQSQLLNIDIVISSFWLLGGISGAIYAHKTGGGGWRGVGYFFLGAIATGAVSHLIALPFQNKIIENGSVNSDSGNSDF